MRYITLNNGIKMPQLGLGTFLIPKDVFSQTINTAYQLGYRQLDTAWRYRNEVDIATALKENGIDRKEMFITTKVNANALYVWGYWYGKHRILNLRNFKTIRAAIEESFANLDTDYIDLFLVHYPWPLLPKMYLELAKLQKQGRIGAIGVSNCLPPHIEYLREFTDVVPAVNQIEISPFNTQKDTIKWCQERGIAVEAMSTFSHFRSVQPRLELLQHPLLMPIADKHNKSVVQVVLRWLLQQDIIMIPKTWDNAKLKENITIFDFELSEQEMAVIDSLDKGRFLNYDPFPSFAALPKRISMNYEPYHKWKEENKI